MQLSFLSHCCFSVDISAPSFSGVMVQPGPRGGWWGSALPVRASSRAPSTASQVRSGRVGSGRVQAAAVVMWGQSSWLRRGQPAPCQPGRPAWSCCGLRAYSGSPSGSETPSPPSASLGERKRGVGLPQWGAAVVTLCPVYNQ